MPKYQCCLATLFVACIIHEGFVLFIAGGGTHIPEQQPLNPSKCLSAVSIHCLLHCVIAIELPRVSEYSHTCEQMSSKE